MVSILWILILLVHDVKKMCLFVASYQETPLTRANHHNVWNLATRKSVLLSAFGPPLIGLATALPAQALGNNTNRRQLEFCLVSVQRVVYWAELQAQQLRAASSEVKTRLYLEARLGAKATLTGKVPGTGSTSRVYTLSTLQIQGCLADLEWYAAQRSAQRVSERIRDFTEGLAAVVEFDGLETLTDPSPRTSLTLAQYTDTKAAFVERALREFVVPAGTKLLQSFGEEPLERTLQYVQLYYASELPEREKSV